FCGFTLGSAFGGIVSAQLVPVIGWYGILVLGGVLALMLFVALLVVLPEPPRWQVRRQLPPALIEKTGGAIARERYV
ncbi:aromatic acid/H+ symport family MFS transporter, partial [Escherichia coli]|nr:aromatic acid/H+ symport family MFS transporter [Escherichia coli]